MDPTVTGTPLREYVPSDTTVTQNIGHKEHFSKQKSLPLFQKQVDYTKQQFPKSIFKHYGALKLANIDAVTKLIGHIKSFLNPSGTDNEDSSFFFLDLCCGKGGFSEYVIYRKAFSKGSGITLGNENDYENTMNFTSCFGGYSDGDIIADPHNVIMFLKRRFPPFHIVLADGVVTEEPIGFRYTQKLPSIDTSTPNIESCVTVSNHVMSYTQLQLLKVQILVGLSVLQKDGNMIIRLSNPSTWEEGKVAYNLCKHFQKSYLFRPITAENAEMYLYCSTFSGEIQEETQMPNDFIEWYHEQCTLAASFVPAKRIDQCFIKWGIPSGFPKPPSRELQAIALSNYAAWRTGSSMSELYEMKSEVSPIPRIQKVKVIAKDHLYEITTTRDYTITLSKSRVDNYLEKVDGDWEYVADIIDWYAPFGFVGFQKLQSPEYVDLYCNPFTRCSKKWVSLYHEKSSEDLNTDDTYIVFVPPFLGAMNLVHNTKARMKVYAPYWPTHPLIQRMQNIVFQKPNLWDYSKNEKYILQSAYVYGDVTN